jgi:hypothetical protein
MQLGTHVPNACAHVSKALDVRATIVMQDVRAGSTVSACKAYRHVAIVQLQCSNNTMDHSPGAATVPNDSTALRHTADQVQHDR